MKKCALSVVLMVFLAGFFSCQHSDVLESRDSVIQPKISVVPTKEQVVGSVLKMFTPIIGKIQIETVLETDSRKVDKITGISDFSFMTENGLFKISGEIVYLKVERPIVDGKLGDAYILEYEGTTTVSDDSKMMSYVMDDGKDGELGDCETDEDCQNLDPRPPKYDGFVLACIEHSCKYVPEEV